MKSNPLAVNQSVWYNNFNDTIKFDTEAIVCCVDFSGINLTEFSMDETEGRYGFLLELHNDPEEQEEE